MRALIPILTFVFITQCLFAQSEFQIHSWLYGLPINKSPETLRKVILKSNHFKEDKTNHTANTKLSKSTYKGKILTPILPINGSIDSAKLSLNIGTLKSIEGYSGDMKWLFFEYFSSDTLFLNDLYDTACKDLITTSKAQKPTGHRIENVVLGKGLNFIYENTTHRLSSISASRVRYLSGYQSFMIIYSGSTN